MLTLVDRQHDTSYLKIGVQGRIQDFKLRGAHLKKLHRAEGDVNIFGAFRVKNHHFTPKNHIFSNFLIAHPSNLLMTKILLMFNQNITINFLIIVSYLSRYVTYNIICFGFMVFNTTFNNIQLYRGGQYYWWSVSE
jgi:hypothetical protein